MTRLTRPVRLTATTAASLAALGALTACAGGSPARVGDDVADTAGSQARTDTGAAAATAGSSASNHYADGTYTATGDYVSPGGRQSVEVTLTLTGGIVTDAEVTPAAQDPRSLGFQEKFASGIADVVIGVPLDELDVDKVAGSSLTSQGFADAAAAIRSEASG